MGLTIGSASATTPVVATPSATQAVTATGGGLTYGVQQAVSGSMIAQSAPVTGGGGNPVTGASIFKRMLVGGVAGAALGVGASLLVGALSGGALLGFTLPAAPFCAAIGGAIGAGLGLVSGLIARRNARAATPVYLPQQQPSAIAPGAGVAPNIIPQSLGKTLKVGTHGSTVKVIQRNLKVLGLWKGGVDGKFTPRLAASIKNYEAMKGVQPTGTSTAEMRVALAQDAALKNRYA